ncbi:terminase large subunit [Caudoviricetes sp.]|nr:terminase large subunit [Caudoviricetes sp.]
MICNHKILAAKNGGACPICSKSIAPSSDALATPLPEDLDDILALAQAVEKEHCRRLAASYRASFYEFFKASWHVLEPTTKLDQAWYLEYVCKHVQAQFEAWIRRKNDPTYRQDLQNGVYNQPPGTSKSRIISVCFNAWAWTIDPTFSVLAISSNPNVALRDADFLRTLIESKWYRETFAVNWEIRDDKKAVGSFQIATYKNGDMQLLGKRRSLGITAKITGERADCILIDDPHDANEVFSDTKREAVINKWKNAIRNRLNNLRSSLRIVIMQRVHPQDLAAEVLKNQQIPFFNVRIRMQYDPDDLPVSPLGLRDHRKYKGELLHPERFDQVTLDAEREAMGDYVFETQYNQTCEETSSGILQLQWFRFFRFDGTQVPNNRPTGSSDVPTLVLSPDHRGRFFDAIYFSIDAAFKKAESQNAKKGAVRSEVGFLIVAKRGANIFIVEDLTAGMTYTEMIDLIKTKSLEYSPTAIYIEDKANGTAAENELRATLNNVVLLEPNGGKEARAQAASPIVRSGHVYCLEGASWVPKFLTGPDSVTIFPRGRRDDRVDALSQVLCEIKPTTNAVDRYKMLANSR